MSPLEDLKRDLMLRSSLVPSNAHYRQQLAAIEAMETRIEDLETSIAEKDKAIEAAVSILSDTEKQRNMLIMHISSRRRH